MFLNNNYVFLFLSQQKFMQKLGKNREQELPLNEENNYKQNFLGIYCVLWWDDDDDDLQLNFSWAPNQTQQQK